MELYDILLAKRLGGGGGGGGSAVINPLSVTANGTYTATGGVDGYSPVTVNVPKPLGTKNITANGDYDVESYASAHVSVSGITPSGTYSITNNGIYDIVSYASVDVNVSGGGGDSRFAQLVDGTITVAIDNTISTIKDYAFYKCTGLSIASFASAKEIGANAFNTCWSLASTSFPEVELIMSSAFSACLNLKAISFPKLNTISASAFRGARELYSLYLMGSQIPTLANINAFAYTPISTSSASGYGSIFVPASLYSSYLEANNWSAYSARFVSV